MQPGQAAKSSQSQMRLCRVPVLCSVLTDVAAVDVSPQLLTRVELFAASGLLQDAADGTFLEQIYSGIGVNRFRQESFTH